VQPDAVAITVSVPAAIAEAGVAERARLLLVLDAVRSERMTWRAAARALELAPAAFLDVARDHGVPVQRVSSDDLATDLASLDRLAIGAQRSP
jgi:hypothetical protein